MELNLPNLTILRDTIQTMDPSRFAMEAWSRNSDGDAMATRAEMIRHDCGTAACIGGWAEVLFVAKDDDINIGTSEDAEIAEALGLSLDQANDLFFPLTAIKEAGFNTNYEQLTQAQAVDVLTHLMETGEVDWLRVVRRDFTEVNQ